MVVPAAPISDAPKLSVMMRFGMCSSSWCFTGVENTAPPDPMLITEDVS